MAIAVPLSPLTLAFKYGWLEERYQRHLANRLATVHDMSAALAVLATQIFGLIAYVMMPSPVSRPCLQTQRRWCVVTV